jgi:hypothetical protein
LGTDDENGGIDPPLPGPGKIVLVTLTPVAGVANLNLSVANVALLIISLAFNASQIQLNLVAADVHKGLGQVKNIFWTQFFISFDIEHFRDITKRENPYFNNQTF